MTQDITGFGSIVNIIADKTFPLGFAVTQFADDADPLDIPAIKILETAEGLNGDMVAWSKAVPIPVTMSVIAGSTDDLNLQILANANRVAQGKSVAGDNITLTCVYPDASVLTLTNGKITEGSFGKSIASAGRLKTRTYSFMFQNKIGS